MEGEDNLGNRNNQGKEGGEGQDEGGDKGGWRRQANSGMHKQRCWYSVQKWVNGAKGFNDWRV